MATNEQLVTMSLLRKVNTVDKSLQDLIKQTSAIVKEHTRSDPAVLKLLTELSMYADTESDQLKQSLQHIGRAFGDLVRERAKMVSTIATELLPLSGYRTVCANMRQVVEKREADLKSRIEKEKKLAEARAKGGKKVTEAELEYMTSCAASNKTDAEMAQKVVEFERKKIIDYRNAIRGVAHAYMTFFARGLEVMTDIFKTAGDISTEAAMQDALSKLQGASPAANSAAIAAIQGVPQPLLPISPPAASPAALAAAGLGSTGSGVPAAVAGSPLQQASPMATSPGAFTPAPVAASAAPAAASTAPPALAGAVMISASAAGAFQPPPPATALVQQGPPPAAGTSPMNASSASLASTSLSMTASSASSSPPAPAAAAAALSTSQPPTSPQLLALGTGGLLARAQSQQGSRGPSPRPSGSRAGAPSPSPPMSEDSTAVVPFNAAAP